MRQPAEGSQRRRVFLLAAGALFLMALVWQHVQATRLGYHVENSRRKILALRCANGALRMQVETLLSPANLSLQARARLDMTLAAPESLRHLDGPAAVARTGLLQRLISRARRTFRELRTPTLQARRLPGRRALSSAAPA
jgi:hypothetical protein